jgi:hypothetical protein
VTNSQESLNTWPSRAPSAAWRSCTFTRHADSTLKPAGVFQLLADL